MAKTKNNQENEELKENVTPEVAGNVGETNTEPTQDAEIKENASNEKQEAEVQVTNEVEKVPTVKEIFRDKYDGKIIYNVGDTFILDEELKDNKPVKVKDKQYKVSKERYEELQRSLYVD